MDYLIASVYFFVCMVLLYRMLRARDVVDFQLGVIAAFSVGYYCLPIWFKHLSPLGEQDEDIISQVILIFFLFGLFLYFGTFIGRKIVPISLAFKTVEFDEFLLRRRKLIAVLAFAYFLYYYFNNELTSYASKDIDLYFNINERGPYASVLALIADISLSFLALCFSLAWRNKRKKEILFYTVMLGFCFFLLLFVGQRLALIAPIVMIMAALAITQQSKKAIKMLVLGIAILILISPLSVYIRESTSNRLSGSAKEAVSTFTYGDAPLMNMFQSIIDRGDIIYVAVRMKSQIDTDEKPGLIYYLSVLVNPIPRALFPAETKPYPLSTNGLPNGELSIYAWRTLIGSDLGSLSSFGGIVAYRELGWIGVIINGILTGIFFVFVARWLGHGGLLISIFYISLFVKLSVRQVPPSFWEALLALMPLLPIIGIIYLIHLFINRSR